MTGGTLSGDLVINGSNGVVLSSGGQLAPDGNVKINTSGYSDWLTNILNTKMKIEPEIYNVPTVLDGVSFIYYKFGKIVFVTCNSNFTPVKTPYEGGTGSVTIMSLADLPDVPRPISEVRSYAHAIAASKVYDCMCSFSFSTDGFIRYECSADNIYAEYHFSCSFVSK